MRHGLRTAKLGRPTAHRVLMLRNLVSSLLQHEQVTTTLPKAKAAQKLAHQLIQWGKDGGKSNWDRANAFLLNPKDTLRPLFTTLAQRYATRPGGYTRIQRAGFRVGDNAPLAVLELVDSASDLRFELAARTVGREMAVRARGPGAGSGPAGWHDLRARVEAHGPDQIGAQLGGASELQPLTRDNVVKALRYRTAPVPVDPATSVADPAEVEETPAATTASADVPSTVVPTVHPATLFLDRAYHHYLAALAEFSLATGRTPDPLRTVKQLTQRLGSLELRGPPRPVLTVPTVGRTPKAGERTDGWQLHLGENEGAAAAEEATETEAKVVAPSPPRRGGPISRAKAGKGRESRAWVAGGRPNGKNLPVAGQ